MTIAARIRNTVRNLEYGVEYDSSYFGSDSSEAIKKALQRNSDIIGKTTTKRFYRKFMDNNTERKPYEVMDNEEYIIHNPDEYSFNCFWQTPRPSKQRVSSVIRNYLSTMNNDDIKTLCVKFGKNRVKAELVSKYKEMYKEGQVNIKGLVVDLRGRYDRNPSYIQLLKIIHDS